MRASAAYLPKRFDEEAFAFFGRTLNGVPEQEERWKRVQAATDGALGEALGQIYVEKAFSAKSKERMKILVENLRASLKDPDSAQFKDVYANYTEEFQVVACGRVNSKNSLGGYTGFKRFVSNGKSAIIEGRDNVADAWAGACL